MLFKSSTFFCVVFETERLNKKERKGWGGSQHYWFCLSLNNYELVTRGTDNITLNDTEYFIHPITDNYALVNDIIIRSSSNKFIIV